MSLVNSPAFNDTFDSPAPDRIGLIVAIYESECHISKEFYIDTI